MFPQSSEGVLRFNRAIIDATQDLVLGYKLNLAFFESLGDAGWSTLRKTRQSVPDALLTIADAKFGDIGSSSRLYASAVFEDLRFDSVTLSPYVGREGLAPFLANETKAGFVLCRTSNRDESFQQLDIDGRPMYERVAEAVSTWGANAGLVVGATDLAALAAVRKLAPRVPLLVPGIGAQGATAEATMAAAVDADGGNALIAVSRAVIYASSDSEFAKAARGAALDLRNSIMAYAA